MEDALIVWDSVFAIYKAMERAVSIEDIRLIDWTARAIHTALEAMMNSNSFHSPKENWDIPWHCVDGGRNVGGMTIVVLWSDEVEDSESEMMTKRRLPP
jgi:hypothetical protein